MSDRHFVHHEDEVQLAKILKESKPWLERYGTTVIYGLAAILAVAAVVVYVGRQPPANAAESQALLLAKSAEDFRDLADKTPDSPIGISARLKEGEMQLSSAMGNLYSNRKVGIEELAAAEKVFRKLEERKDLNDETRLRVLVGLARVVEARCNGNDETVKASIEAWDRILKEFPDSKMFNKVAEDRKKKLNEETTKSFYAWFQQQDPKPGDDLLLPQDGPGKVPDIPSLNIPDFTTPITPEKDAPKDGTKPEGAAPAEGSAPVEGSAPAAPAPAEGAAPAEPATSEPAKEGAAPAAEPAKPTEGAAPAAPATEGAAPAPAPAPAEGAAPAAEPAAPAPATPEKSGE